MLTIQTHAFTFIKSSLSRRLQQIKALRKLFGWTTSLAVSHSNVSHKDVTLSNKFSLDFGLIQRISFL